MLKGTASAWLVLVAAIVAAAAGTAGGAAIGAYVLADSESLSTSRNSASGFPAGSGLPDDQWPEDPQAGATPAPAWEAIEGDPGRVAIAIQDYLDPDPATVASALDEVELELRHKIEELRSEVDELRDVDVDDLNTAVERVRSDLESLCGELAYADALSDLYLPC